MELPSTSWLIQLKDAVSLEMDTSETDVTLVSPSKWNIAETLVQVLKPIADETLDLGGQKYGTLSSVMPFLYGAKQILKRCSTIKN